MANRLFGGANLGDIARSVKDGNDPAPLAGPTAAKPTMATAELALRGRTGPSLERENIFQVDPKRVRGWKYHNRTAAWYTKERCQDLIDSLAKDGQQEPAMARKLTGDPDADYELIYGMRRRFACEFLSMKLKLRVVGVDDARAAVLMHVENFDRQDITPMERAISFYEQMKDKLFASQDALADAMGLSKGQVAKMLRGAGLMFEKSIGALFPDKSVVPINSAYTLATLFERQGAKEVILQAAQNLARKGGEGRPPSEVLKTLIKSLDRSSKFEPIRKTYNIGPAAQVTVTRNPKGKVTLAFSKGLQASMKDEIFGTLDAILKDLG